MGQLFFKKPLQIAIREGRKRTTIRRWAKPRVRAGKRAYALGVGWLHIQSIEAIDLAQLTHADAVADGFSSREAMMQTLVALYPRPSAEGESWFRVHFHLLQLEPTRVRAASRDPMQYEFSNGMWNK